MPIVALILLVGSVIAFPLPDVLAVTLLANLAVVGMIARSAWRTRGAVWL